MIPYGLLCSAASGHLHPISQVVIDDRQQHRLPALTNGEPAWVHFTGPLVVGFAPQLESLHCFAARVWSDSAYRANAQRLQQAIRRGQPVL